MISSFDQGSYQFLTKQLSLWKRSSGDPRDSTNLGDTETLKGKFDGKLVGNYDFPFSIPFPTYVDPASRAVVSMRESDISPSLSPIEAVSPFEMASDEHTKVSPWTRKTGSSSNQNFLSHQLVPTSSTAIMEQMASPTPQTFIERGITATVTYTIAVLFIHGWFKHESRSVSVITLSSTHMELMVQNQNEYYISSGFSTSSCFAEETASIRSRRLHSWTIKRPRWLVYIAKCYNPWYHHLSRLAQADQDRL